MSAWQERVIKWTCVGLEVCCLCLEKLSQPPSYTDMWLEIQKTRASLGKKELVWMTGFLRPVSTVHSGRDSACKQKYSSAFYSSLQVQEGNRLLVPAPNSDVWDV